MKSAAAITRWHSFYQIVDYTGLYYFQNLYLTPPRHNNFSEAQIFTPRSGNIPSVGAIACEETNPPADKARLVPTIIRTTN